MQLLEEKSSLRKRMLAKRRSMSPEERERADRLIESCLKALPELSGAKLVAAYVSDGTEPDLSGLLSWLLKSGRRVCLPRSSAGGAYEFAEVRDMESGLVSGPYGIKEPPASLPAAPKEELKEALWLVPGVAFDAAGGRLGRGKGVYDRLLAGGSGFSIGVFYDFQMCAELPVERHDLGLDIVVTESGVRGGSAKRKEDKGK